jgi:hypothetical protein
MAGEENMNKIRPHKLKNIEYELHLLFGADLIITEIEKNDTVINEDRNRFGNIINYFKDSIYLHTRNLFNLLTNEGLTEIGNIPKIQSETYKTWKKSIERYVMHLDQARDQKGNSNVINNKHLNNQTHLFTDEIKYLVKLWIKGTEKKNKAKIEKIYSKAERNANNDLARFKKLFENKRL